MESEPDSGFDSFDALTDDVDELDPDGAQGEDTADLDTSDSEAAHTALPGKVESWRRRSATGAVLTGFALGLQQVFEKEHEQPAVIMQTSGDPPRDLPVEADVERARPRHSVVNIRPWLLSKPDDAKAGDADVDPDVTPGGNPEPEDR
jgi:hypothetical protein